MTTLTASTDYTSSASHLPTVFALLSSRLRDRPGSWVPWLAGVPTVYLTYAYLRVGQGNMETTFAIAAANPSFSGLVGPLVQTLPPVLAIGFVLMFVAHFRKVVRATVFELTAVGLVPVIYASLLVWQLAIALAVIALALTSRIGLKLGTLLSRTPLGWSVVRVLSVLVLIVANALVVPVRMWLR